MIGPDQRYGGFTPDEMAAIEATDDPRERVKLMAGGQRRVRAERRAEAVSEAWQRLLAA